MITQSVQMATPETETVDVFFGFDLSKLTFEVACRQAGLPPVQREDLRKIKTHTYKRTREGVEEWWKHASVSLRAEQRVGVVMEVTSSYSLEVAAWLMSICPQVKVSVMPGKRIRDWASGIGVDDKNDPMDARVMACFGAERQPQGQVPLEGIYAKLRALCRTRLVLVEQSVATRQRLDEAASEYLDPQTSKFLQRTLSKVLRELDKQIEALEKQMKSLIAEDKQLSHDVELLDTIAGVGWHTAVTVLVELGDMRGFRRRSQLVSRAGLNPVIRISGTSVEKRPRISKKGSCRARRALYLAAISTLQGDTVFAITYRNLVQRGKKKMVAIVAVMRKMLLVMRSVVISGKRFDPNRNMQETH